MTCEPTGNTEYTQEDKDNQVYVLLGQRVT